MKHRVRLLVKCRILHGVRPSITYCNVLIQQLLSLVENLQSTVSANQSDCSRCGIQNIHTKCTMYMLIFVYICIYLQWNVYVLVFGSHVKTGKVWILQHYLVSVCKVLLNSTGNLSTTLHLQRKPEYVSIYCQFVCECMYTDMYSYPKVVKLERLIFIRRCYTTSQFLHTILFYLFLLYYFHIYYHLN